MAIRSATHAASEGKRLLSAREREVAVLISHAATNRDIAQVLDISEKTVEHHVSSILRKLGVRSRTQLVAQYLALRDTIASNG